jgi:hypothetical protein
VIEDPDVDQGEGLLDSLGEHLVGL